MIWIFRKFLFVSISNSYFTSGNEEDNHRQSVKGFSHSLMRNKDLQPIETIHIDLEKSEGELFAEIDKENRRQIRKAEKQNMQFVVIKHPSDVELKNFQTFYNRFAIQKHTYRCNAYHMHTMKKLLEKNALIFTYMADAENNNVHCYRIYVTDGEMAMTLYSASDINPHASPEKKRRLSEANRYLLWKNMTRFKSKGVKILDMGGLTDQPSIRKFKTGFGGEVVTVYSGYTAHSLFGKLLLFCRKQLFRKSRNEDA